MWMTASRLDPGRQILTVTYANLLEMVGWIVVNAVNGFILWLLGCVSTLMIYHPFHTINATPVSSIGSEKGFASILLISTIW